MRTQSAASDGTRAFATAANLVSLSRILLVPFAIATGSSDRGLACFVIVLAICASDILDGAVARATGTAGPIGAALDVVADGVAVFALQAALVARGHWSPHVLATSAGAYAVFLVCARRNRQIVRKPIGRYLGAAVMVALLVHTGLTVLAPDASAVVVDAAGWALTVYGAVAVIENVYGLGGASLRRQRPLAGRVHDHTWVVAVGFSDVHKL